MMPRVCTLLLSFCALGFSQTVRTINKVVSAASGVATIAPNSIVTIYGANLADSTASATTLPLPTQLAGIAVVVNNLSYAQLLYASPTQINFVVPAGAQPGMDSVRVVTPEIIYATATVSVQPVVPAIFSANGEGRGVAAAVGIRTVIPTNIQSTVDVFTCDATTGNCQAVPVDLGVDAPVILELFGTGIRGGSNITATIGVQPVPVAYAGPQPQYPGLDQVNLPLKLNLRGIGTVDVILTVDGQVSNPVQVAIQ
jgi:uncharacterized protein (TIGR03437 family)